jgi:hypothetical protein
MKNKQSIEKASQKGAVLITLIVAMVIMALASSGMLYFTSTSSYGEFFANRQERAYYIGESGVNYALQKYLADGTLYPESAPVTMTFLNGDQFKVISYIEPKGDPAADWLVIKSTGTVGSGWLTTKQLVTKEILKATATPPGIPPIATDTSGVPLGFDANTDTNVDTTWEVTTTTDSSDVDIYDGALEFENIKEGAIILNSDAVSLCNAWVSNGYLSSYLLQVKISNDKANPKYFIHGLSFRVQDAAATSSYGLSYYMHNGTNCNDPWCADTIGIRDNVSLTKDGKIYVVLWKKVNGSYSVLASAWMDSTYGVVGADGYLKDWSTLLIKVNERTDGNHLKAYVQDPSLYPRDTTNWNISSLKPVVWTWPTTSTEIIDNTFPSAGLCTCTAPDVCTPNRPEIGVHAFYDASCVKCQLFDDFGLAVQGTTGGSSQY